MAPRTRSLLISGALFLLLFFGGFASSYVYQHEPVRDTLEVSISSDSSTGVHAINGTVSEVRGGELTLTTAAGPITVALPAATRVDELTRASDGLPEGTRVNVGVQSTGYGLVLTGLVAVENAP